MYQLFSKYFKFSVTENKTLIAYYHIITIQALLILCNSQEPKS